MNPADKKGAVVLVGLGALLWLISSNASKTSALMAPPNPPAPRPPASSCG